MYKNEIRIDPRPCDAVRRVQCQPLDNDDSDLEDLTHIDCAYGVCQLCPKFELPLTEQALTETDLLISFHTYQQVTSCGIHLAISSGVTECHACATRQIGEPIGRLTKKTQLVLMNVPFKIFFENYYLPSLMKYRMHRYLYIILSKNHTGKDRRNISEGEVWTQRDFAERLTLKFNNEAQVEHFGGGRTVSLKGMAIEFFPVGKTIKIMEFHTYLSDGKQQDSAVVNDHMESLIQVLKKEKILKDGGVIMCTSDGCAAQYRCATAYQFLSSLAYKYKIAIDRFISAPGHGMYLYEYLCSLFP